MRELNDREHAVVKGIMLGMKNKAIAAEIGISEQSVKNALINIFAVTGANNRVQLAMMVQKTPYSARVTE